MDILGTSIGSAQVRAVQLQQVEGVEERLRLVPPVPEHEERSHTTVVAAHNLAVDQAGPHLANRFANVGNEQMELLLSRQARLS